MSAVAPRTPTSRPPLDPADRAVHLFGLLDGVRRWRMFQAGAAASLLGAAALLLGGLLLIFSDAVLGLPAPVRVALDVVAVVGFVAACGWTIRELVRQRADARQAARLVECALGLQDSVLINAVEFAFSPVGDDSPQLRARTISLAEERARRLLSHEVLSFRSLWRSLGLACGAVLLGLASWLIAPQLFAAVLPRYLDPHGDHPPYTLTTFEVTITPEPVYHGRAATITAHVGGPVPIEEAAVVFLAAQPDGSPTRLPMFRREETTFALSIERAGESRRFYIDTPQGRSATLDFAVLQVPFFEEVTVRYEYPAYTGWEPQVRLLDDRGLRGIVGTTVTLQVRSNLPLQSGRLDFTPSPGTAAADRAASATPHGIDVELTPLADNPRVATGRLVLAQDGHFAVQLRGVAGGESLAPLTGTVTVTPDQPPRVAILAPQPHLIVVENFKVPVTIEAVDDVGVSRLRLSRSVNQWGPSTVELPLQELRPGVVHGTSGFDLGALGARAGDIITYYATAADNHPDPTQFADSPTYLIQVISEEEYLQYARQQYQLDDLAAEMESLRQDLEELQRKRDAAVRELAEELAKNTDDPELRHRLEQAAEGLHKYADEAERLARRVAERSEQLRLYDLEQPYHEMLQRLSKQLHQDARSVDAAAETIEQLSREEHSEERQRQLQEALESLRRNEGLLQERQQFESARPDLELFQLADGLLQQVERLKGIIPQQRELAHRLREFQNRESLTPLEQQRADQLAKEQELLEQELEEVRQQLEQAADRAQDRLPKMSSSARDICQQIGTLEIPGDQQAAAARARAGAGREAHERAESAAGKLESLASACQSCQGEGAGELGEGLDGPLSLSSEGVQRTLEQLAQGRNLPGPPRPGAGEGRGGQAGQAGSGGTGANGDAQGGAGETPPCWRPGQSFPGSQARTPILGPRTTLESPQARPGGQLGGNQRGTFLPDHTADPIGAAESLTPESRTFRPSSAGSLRGVPVPYRRDAEAYFRRLAEDAAQP